MLTRRCCALIVPLVLLTVGFGSMVLAQEEPAEEQVEDPKQELAKNWEEFLHYVNIGREDAARSYAMAIIEAPVEDREVYRLSETTETGRALLRGARLNKELKELITKIQQRINKGFEAERSDPKYIAKQIDRLGATMRAYTLATRRLQLSGEYALPQLLQRFADPKTSDSLKERIVSVLPKLGREVVRGLSVALQTKDPQVQEMLCGALGELGYPHSVPRIKELLEREDVLSRTRAAARAAIISCAGHGVADKPTAELFYDLAVKYYDRSESLVADPRYEKANVWYWQEGLGLTYKPVPREIFCDVYAMRCALLGLKHDPSFYPAVSVWIAANLNKEANLPSGATDPTRGADQPAASYYALGNSAGFLQEVLRRALEDRNSAVAIGAIQALAKTAGAKNLLQPVEGGAMPLVRALTYPDREVRFLAAVSLANALPERRFEGYQQVLWVLNEALRQTGKKTALLMVSDLEKRNALKDAIRAAGYEVIDEPKPSKGLGTARTLGTVDVLVLGDKPSGSQIVAAARRDPLLLTTPVVCSSDDQVLKNLAEKDGRMIVIAPGTEAERMAEALEEAGRLGVGKAMTPEQAANWAIRAAQAIRRVGETGNVVYDISRSLRTLVAVLGNPRADVRIAAARALAVTRDAEAQQGIAALGNNPEVAEDVRIAIYQGLSESLRRFGNQLTEELAQGVIEVVKGKGSQALREAAAQALGAMDLPSQRISSLLLETAGED